MRRRHQSDGSESAAGHGVEQPDAGAERGGRRGGARAQPYKQEEAEDKKRYLKELSALGLT